MLLWLHTISLETIFFLILRPSLLLTDNSLCPPQFPHPDMIPLSLFELLRLFFNPLAHRVVCLLQNKVSVTHLFFSLNLFFHSDCLIFPLLLLSYSTTAQGEVFESPVGGKPPFLSKLYAGPFE